MQYAQVAAVPMAEIGPIKIIGQEVTAEVMVPMATYESPLWPSTNRGAKISRLANGIKATVIQDHMTRSIVLSAADAAAAAAIIHSLQQRFSELQALVATTSNYAKLKDWHYQVVGNLLYLRFAMFAGDASGHNMATNAAEGLLNWLLEQYPQLKYVSISANYCTDKKASAVNGILGRGKYVVAEITIPRAICVEHLKALPENIVDLNIKKNLIGTNLAGGLRSANAHFANMLLAVYLATGQDAANIIEGSQGIVHAELRGADLYFSVTLPNLIVGTVGNGKHLEFARQNLLKLGCLTAREPGLNSRRLAIIIAATVLCGELSLLAAQTNPGELMRTHFRLERAAQTAAKTGVMLNEQVASMQGIKSALEQVVEG